MTLYTYFSLIVDVVLLIDFMVDFLYHFSHSHFPRATIPRDVIIPSAIPARNPKGPTNKALTHLVMIDPALAKTSNKLLNIKCVKEYSVASELKSLLLFLYFFELITSFSLIYSF